MLIHIYTLGNKKLALLIIHCHVGPVKMVKENFLYHDVGRPARSWA